MNVVDRMFEEAKKDAEKQKIIRQQLEAKARLDELSDSDDEVADDSTAEIKKRKFNLDLLNSRGDMDEESSQGGEPNSGPSGTGTRRSARIRSGSLTSQTRTSVPPSTSRTKAPSKKLSEADRFLVELRQQERQGVKTGDAGTLLQAIKESESPTKPDHQPYPTPRPDSDGFSNGGSGNDEAGEEDDGRLSDMDLDVLARSDLDGVLDVARELNESRRGSARQTADSATIEWDGFWENESTGTATATATSMSSDNQIDLSAVLYAKTSTFDFVYDKMSSAALVTIRAAGVYKLRIWRTEVSIPDEVIAGTYLIYHAVYRLRTMTRTRTC